MSDEMQKSFHVGRPREEMVRPIQVYPMSQSYAQQLERMSQPQDELNACSAFVTGQAAKETATPVNRAIALVVRMLPFTGIWFVLALGVVAFLHVDESYGFALFAILTAATFYMMNEQEYNYSTNGLEHHRIDAAERLASQKLVQDAAIRREITQAYLKHLGGLDQ